MPPKKSAPFLPPVQPLQTETMTKVQVESPILVGTITVCCLALLAVFGASFMQGLISINSSLLTYKAATLSQTNTVPVALGKTVEVPLNADVKILSFKLAPTVDSKVKVVKSVKFNLLAGMDLITESSSPNLEFKLGVLNGSNEDIIGTANVFVNGVKAGTGKEIAFNTDIPLPADKEFILHIVDHANVSGSFGISSGPGSMAVWADLKSAKVGGTMLIGQSVRLSASNNGIISSVNFATSSAMTLRYIVGGSTANKWAVYTIKAANGPIIIDKMEFKNISSDHMSLPISQLSLAGRNYNSNENFVLATDLGIQVPIGYAGVEIPVSAIFKNVGPNPLIPSELKVNTSLTYIEYHTPGGSPQSLHFSDDTHPNAGGILVGSLPMITLGQSSAGIRNGEVLLAYINLLASPSGGNIGIQAIPVEVMTSPKILITQLTLKDGNTLVPAITSFNGPTSRTLNLKYSLTISPLIPKILSLYGTVSTTAPILTPNSEYISVGLGNPASLLWNDINGGRNNLTGEYIYGYSTDPVSIHN